MKYANVLKYAGISLFVVVLVAGHVIGLRHLFSHLAWPIAVGMIVLVLLKHIGIFGPIYGSFKRRSRGSGGAAI